MNLKLLIPAGLLALVAGLVIYLPAPVIAGWAEAQVPGLELTGVSGNAFTGRAQYVGLNDITLEDVRWQLSPLALFLGRADVNLRVSTDTGSLSGDVSRGLFGRIQLQNLNGSASLGWLGGLAGYRFVPLDGLLKLENVSAKVQQRTVSDPQGQVLLNNANWLLVKPPLVFGSMVAALESNEQGNGVQIIESDGPLKVEGQARLLEGNRYTVDMRVRARAGADQRLQELLKQLGRPDAQGWYRISERGSL